MMVSITYTAGGQTLRGSKSSEDFSVQLVTANDVLSAGSSGVASYKDCIGVGSTTTSEFFKSNVVAKNSFNQPDLSYRSLTESICTVDQSGVVTGVTGGVCVIEVTGKYGVRRTTQAVYTNSSNTVVFDSLTSYDVGSLREYLSNQAMAALDGVASSGDTQRTDAVIGGLRNGINPNLFLLQAKAGFDGFNKDLLEQCIDHYKIWITPHHYITWYGHGMPASGVKDGQPWMCPNGETIIQYSPIAWLGELALLPPPNWYDYAPSNWNITRVAEACAWIRLTWTYTEGAELYWVQPISAYPNVSGLAPDHRFYQYQRQTWDGKLATGGDSGSPMFVGIGGRFVFIGSTHSKYTPAEVQMLQPNIIAQIQECVDALDASGPYTVGVVDLGAAGFTSYA